MVLHELIAGHQALRDALSNVAYPALLTPELGATLPPASTFTAPSGTATPCASQQQPHHACSPLAGLPAPARGALSDQSNHPPLGFVGKQHAMGYAPATSNCVGVNVPMR